MRPFRLKTPRVPEHDIQEQVCRVLRLALGSEVFWSSLDHANARNAKAGAMRKARGVRAGLPDMEFVFRGQYHGIELKAADGALSPIQIETHSRIKTAGGKIATCNSVETVLEKLREWNIPIRVRIAA